VIQVNRLHGAGSIVINADLIETIEACPDTHITLITKRKFVVENTLEDVVDRVLAYRQRASSNATGRHLHELGEAA
jgi:flagellar protein FlbD